jgi:hypothetical protein
MIDGAAHPERVSDSTAYRLYFLTVSELPNPTPEAKTRQLAHLSKVHLEAADLHSLISAMETFKQQYSALVDQYNREATVIDLAGGTPNIESFLIQRDALVQSTRDALKQTLTTDGMTRLHTHIQDEKRKMKIAAAEAQ